MIKSVQFDRSPIRPGESRPIQVEADGDIEIEFFCFRDPPGKFVRCGKIVLQPNESAFIGPDRQHFPKGHGRWLIKIWDKSDKNTKEIELMVGKFPPPGSTNTRMNYA